MLSNWRRLGLVHGKPLFGSGGTRFVSSFSGGNGLSAGIHCKHFPGSGAASTSTTTVSRALGDVSINMNTCAVVHPKYELVDDSLITEYGVRQFLYRHLATGAQVVSVIAPDDNKVFGITFRTPPADSTGIPHILEHSVLCGSKQYPSKEPFVELLKGSLNTFLNAFTYPDRTCYPVASQNTKDFYNLVNVYLDAVLFPRAVNDSRVLQQEGWHYELENPDDELVIKGVVFNEMKGVYSSPDSLRSRATQRALFQENQYHVDSGGDPKVIPELTFEQFQQFHQDYYHPSNARIFFYGNDDPNTRLELLDQYLSQFTQPTSPVDSAISFQKKIDKPWKLIEYFPVAKDTPKKHVVTVNWLLNDSPLTMKEELALDILDHLLLGTPSSILHKTLIESGLGESVCGGGLSGELLQSTFGVGLKGIKPEDVDKVEELILETLIQISETGFSSEAIEASINTIEFHLREFNTGSFPRGLSMMLGMMRRWIYDGEPAQGVRFEESLNELKAELATGKFSFSNLVEKYLLKNKHRMTLEMQPSTTMEGELIASETSKLQAIKEKMTRDELEHIIANTKRLKQFQEQEDTPEVLAKIPRVNLSDIERNVKKIPIEIWENTPHSVEVVTHDMQTNGIIYADVAFDMSSLSLEEFTYLPLFRRLLMESGTSTMDDVTLTRRIGAQTGGIRPNTMNTARFRDTVNNSGDDIISMFMFRGKAVKDKSKELFEIINEIASDCNLNNQRKTLEILKEQKIQYENAVISSGHSFASTRIASRFSLMGLLAEHTGGITYLQKLREMIEQAEADWPSFVGKLETIREKVFKRENLIINLTGDFKTLEQCRPFVDQFILTTKGGQGNVSKNGDQRTFQQEWDVGKLLRKDDEGLVVPTQVNYVGKGGQLFQEGEHVPGSASVISKFLSTGYMWNNVRVMGGAYGGFASFGPTSGRMVFLSYRDPNLVNTLNIYDNASAHLQNLEITDDMIEKAIIGAIGDMDTPKMPDQEGLESFQQYLRGESDEDRQRWRDEVLATSKEDFKNFAERLAKFEGTVSVVGSLKAIEEANKELNEKQTLKVIHVVESETQQPQHQSRL